MLWVLRVAVLALFFFLPGYALLGLGEKPTRRGALEGIALPVLTSILATSLVSLGLACAGWLSLLRVCCILAAVTVAGTAVRLRSGRLAGGLSLTPTDMVLAGGILLVAVPLCFRPHEYLGGGWDPGVYLHVGANIARTGSINWEDPGLAALTGKEREIFSTTTGTRTQLFPGMRIADAERGFVSPQFYHLYSCWLALFHAMGGTRWALYVNSVFACLSLVSVYLLARTLFGPAAGVWAVLLLAVNAVQVWYARFSTAEILTQYFVWSGFYLFAEHAGPRRAGAGVLAGLCFGCAMLTRVSAVMIVPPLLLVLGHRALAGEGRRDLGLWLTLLAGLLLSTAYNRFVAVTYMDVFRCVEWAVHRYRWPVIMGVAAAAGLTVAGIRHRRPVARIATGNVVRAALGMCLVSLAAYAFFFRPELVSRGEAARTLSGDALKRLFSRAAAFREMAWFVSAPGLALGVAGAVGMLWRGLPRAGAAFYLCSLTVALVFFHDKMIEPFYMFTSRRFVPVVVPALAVWMAFALSRAGRGGRRRRAASVVLGLVVVLLPLRKGLPLMKHVDFAGMTEFCGRVDAGLGPERGGVVVCDDDWLAAPLRFIHGRNAVAIQESGVAKHETAEQIIARWVSKGRRVRYLTTRDMPIARDLHFVPMLELRFSSSCLEQTLREYPSRLIPREATVRIYGIELPGGPERGGGTVLHPGRYSFGLYGGFGRSETVIELLDDFRWSRGDASVDLGAVPAGTDRAIAIRLAAPRPKRRWDTEVDLTLGGAALGTVLLRAGDGFVERRLPIPVTVLSGGVGKRSLLGLSCPTWNPAKLGVSEDGRDLGVMVDWIKVQKGSKVIRTVDVGADESGSAGFHAAEQHTAGRKVVRAVRALWPPAAMAVPSPPDDTAQCVGLTIGPRTSEGAGRLMALDLAGTEIGRIQLEAGLRDYEVAVPPGTVKADGARSLLQFRLVDPALPVKGMQLEQARLSWGK